MVLAIEVGMGDCIAAEDIQKQSDRFLEAYIDGKDAIDARIQTRVDAARSRGCVLRHISSVNVREQSIQVQLMDVPEHHVFALTPPSCECVRFFTHSHSHQPLIVYGPSAGVDSTSSALLAELLYLMREKASPQSVALSRRASGVVHPL